ncbi:endo-1,4-beta-xylanase [Microbacterium sp. EYE_5]|uniref:endo-1,4-beta-xylanase n=1 Tax=unclassified Microbacterium TaxID=2609290 RepID=UPI002006D35B|nr:MULTISPECIES: endo-1,4-beta-xylanase [unclassified Microbacterium]MCK6079406.1 endo-1,4-beta-xylanase [Microbacterium sp. EYE_382]MCK6084676.1 endo-1,4-beta-xylanase [Microbacterium sp. EYE_384]MCK6123095.1 endo-1,4-beta-xylanase [Microbacterium sp. EYE_80]MCK6125440.1 endo-1,4-beta-xylanase [Microbacterium sp. EYE_79]MCK6140360.1 endo-1,4-beta-xylanase [Microbacterium sp. EYE_39]
MKALGRVALASAVVLGLTLTSAGTANAEFATDPSIRELAEQAGILFGAGSVKASESTADDRPANYFTDPRYGRVLSEQFNSLSPENEFKWNMVQPQEGVFDFDGLDRLVAFAEEHDMEVKAHSGISRSFNPDYLVAKTDPAEFRQAVIDHFTTIMQRYTGKMDRWDVATEVFTTFGGEGLEHNLFYERMGPNYLSEVFRIAHAADPTAKLFINENMVEFYPAKRQELYDLVAGMVADGVPIDGVALQMHETIVGPQPGVLTGMVNDYRALGLEVSIAELDVHTYDPASQAQIYGDVVAEALAAGITEISTWGFTDKHLYTWLPGAKPTIFDEEFNPKPAYFAVRDALQSFGHHDSAPGKARLSNTSGWAKGLHDGNYTVAMNLHHGTPGSYYRLYENNVLIDAKQLNAVGVTSQSAETSVSGKPNGTYSYRAELINSKGVTKTSTTTVKVKDAAPGRPDISTDNWDHDANFTATANLWWGTNATSYAFFLDGVRVGEGKLNADTPKAQTATVSLQGVEVGLHKLTVTFTNAHGSTDSKPLAARVR